MEGISREILRAELAELKLDLVERLVSRSEHIELEKRVHNAEQAIGTINESRAKREHLEMDVYTLKGRLDNLTVRTLSLLAVANVILGVALFFAQKYL